MLYSDLAAFVALRLIATAQEDGITGRHIEPEEHRFKRQAGFEKRSDAINAIYPVGQSRTTRSESLKPNKKFNLNKGPTVIS